MSGTGGRGLNEKVEVSEGAELELGPRLEPVN